VGPKFDAIELQKISSMLKGHKKGPKRRFAIKAVQQVQGGFSGLSNCATTKNLLWNKHNDTHTHDDSANESVKYIYI